MNSISGSELRINNEKIVQYMKLLKQQKDELAFLIEKQEEEKVKIQNEIEKLTYKLALLAKSLAQRIEAKSNYERTIKEIYDNYGNLVDASGKLLNTINQDVIQLETIMDKKTGSADPIPNEALELSSHNIKSTKRKSSLKTSNQDSGLGLRRFSNITEDDNSDEDNFHKGDIETKDINEEPQNNNEKQNDSVEELRTPENKIQKINPSIDEVQTFREAYDRQHRNSRTQSLMPTKKVHTQEPSLRSLIQKS